MVTQYRVQLTRHEPLITLFPRPPLRGHCQMTPCRQTHAHTQLSERSLRQTAPNSLTRVLPGCRLFPAPLAPIPAAGTANMQQSQADHGLSATRALTDPLATDRKMNEDEALVECY